jgi:hypothetical protein
MTEGNPAGQLTVRARLYHPSRAAHGAMCESAAVLLPSTFMLGSAAARRLGYGIIVAC